MAFLTGQTWYCGSTKYTAVAQWTALTVYAAGQIVRQLAAPAVNSERCFVCTVAGTSLVSEPTWVITQGGVTAETAGPTWTEITGKAGVNGDLADTTIAPRSTAVSVGVLVKNATADTYFVCKTAGTTASSAPSWNTTAGATTTDGTAVFTSIGAVGNFAGYAAPWARLSPAFTTTTFPSAGDTIYVSNNHAATTTAAIAYTSAATVRIICVSDSAVPPTTTATTASETSSASTLTISGAFLNTNQYIYGLNFFSASTMQLSAGIAQIYFNCSFNLTASNNIGFGSLGTYVNYVEFNNCTFTFGSTTATFAFPTGRSYINGGSIAATGTLPTTLFNAQSQTGGGECRIRDCDISAVTGTLFTLSQTTSVILSLENCKLGTTTYTSGTNTPQSPVIKIHNSASTSANYNYFYSAFWGQAFSSISIYRNGGYSSGGVTPLSLQCVTNSNASYYSPFELEDIAFDSTTTGSSVTATIQLTTNTALTNATCWMVIEYLGNASFPLGSRVSTQAALLATPVSLSNSSSTWAGTGQTHIYQIATSFTPQMIGIFKAYVFLAAPSATVYVDPQITLS